MTEKTMTLYFKKDGKVKRATRYTKRRFFAFIRACSAEKYRVVVKYDNSEYPGEPLNDSGWYSNKQKLLETTRAFLNE